MPRVYAIAMVALAATPIHGQTLKGSRASVDRQYEVAVQHDYSFLDGVSDVNRFVGLGLLVPLEGNANYELAAVSQPYARPAVRTFVERLSAQYRAACGEKLVVTSLTRPSNRQPRNASEQSVHPAGMAVDFRVSNNSRCRRWIEDVLLSLEKADLVEATRERRPLHYHIAVFPRQYLSYVERLEGRDGARVAASPRQAPPQATAAAGPADSPVDETDSPAAQPATGLASYRVQRGDTLWSIAQRHQTSVQQLRQLNGLRGNRILAGQVIVVPG